MDHSCIFCSIFPTTWWPGDRGTERSSYECLPMGKFTFYWTKNMFSKLDKITNTNTKDNIKLQAHPNKVLVVQPVPCQMNFWKGPSQLKIKFQNIKVVDKVVQGSRGGGSFIPRAKKVPAWTFCTCRTMNDPVLNRTATFLLWLPLVFPTELIHNSHTCYWRGVTTLERGRPYILGWFCAQLQKVFSGRTFATK